MAPLWVFCILVCCLFIRPSRFVLGLASSNVYIVYMGERQHSEAEQVQDSHHKMLAHVLGSKEAAEEAMLYSYKHGFSGFSAILSQSQAKLIADLPGVARVMPNRILSLQTTRSWDFLHMYPQMADGILSKGRSGAGSIIGVLDTGIWPESMSFREEGMATVPLRWNGICQEGEQFNKTNCNRKIIGARWYIKGYEAEFGKLNTSEGAEFLSPRDAVGHGTHTASTAAGALVENVSFMGLARGLARGGAPSAHIATYKICWATGGCSSADLLAAFDDAIHDGVDVLSASLGSSPPLPSYVDDTLAIGSFHAVARGISVVCSGGNSGPYPQTVINTAPWLITVGASTIDRAFPTTITLGNNRTLMGQALYTGKNVDKFYPIVYGEDIVAANSDESSARSCDFGSLNSTLAKGKAVLCFQSRSQRSATIAVQTVEDAEGVGMIFAKFPTKDVDLSTKIPCILVDFTIGTSILNYMEATKDPVVKFSGSRTVLGQQISPEVAVFSSRGPSSLSPSVLKPDIAAPGVNILAAWSPASSQSQVDPNTNLPLNFKIESGTSMSCPHVSGIVALLRTVHPDWSPAMIRSALITKASVKDTSGQRTVAEGAPHKPADAFDYGGGHVDPNRSLDPGLVFDTKTSDYVCFLCSLGYNDSAISSMTGTPTQCHSHSHSNCLKNLNQPSIVVPDLKQHVTISREVTNVGRTDSIYIARVEAPPGTHVKVKPPVLVFNSNVKTQKFRVSFQSLLRFQGRYSFGTLVWEDGKHRVRMPLAVRSVIDDFYAQT
ncbi:subtilisin-like protease SBT3.9 isoform X1 [Punica granatum]|uniref:Subtilisin-like protease SBT3.9 isoform X1 n=2 Tax=Punica granatum TaxID=22663 RepID=A0A6P8CJL5_PUNGR|nr:subtilisin-like protease SBT3.9 isoform X1 [Punica granatum]PKI37202.1 hypothetical protein CRG98_042393 [Punica granatum]